MTIFFMFKLINFIVLCKYTLIVNLVQEQEKTGEMWK